METITKTENAKSRRDLHYYRQRYKNRVFARLSGFVSNEMERNGLSKKDIAERLGNHPSLITRWLSSPSNITLDTLSDLLFALDAEPEPPEIVLFKDRKPANYMHPLAAAIVGAIPKPAQKIETSRTEIDVKSVQTGNNSGDVEIKKYESAKAA